MDTQQLGIITLLRSALNGESLTLPEDFDWSKASKVLYAHHLTGLALHGAALCGVPRSHPAIVQMTASFCKGLKESRDQMKALQEILDLFDAHGIDYMPVKGAVLKGLYPRPEYRIMVDADVLIRLEQYPKIRQLLLDARMNEDVETDYELTWVSPALRLELHSRLVPEFLGAHSVYYSESWRFAQKDKSGSGYHLSPEDHFIYLLEHFSKHYLTATICAKDICDFHVWRKAHPDMDEAYIRAELEKLQLVKFYDSVLELLDAWFAGKNATQAAELITQTAFCGGVFEEYNESAAKGMMKRYSNEGDSLLTQKLKWFLNAMFPAYHRMTYHYPVLKKCPVLLPVFWVVHWFVALFRDRDKIKRGLVVMKMDESSHSQYRDHMQTVGLQLDENR